MRNQNCGCRRNNCPICCNRNNRGAATGPTGPIGPTGPCCTGPTGAPAPVGPRIFAGGQFSVDEECNLILFNSQGVSALEAYQVAPGVRGWRVTFDPIPCADLPVFRPANVFGHAVFPQDDGSVVETPSVHIVSSTRTVINLGDGTCQLQFDYFLEDNATGTPIDPCTGSLFFSIFPFQLIGAGAEAFTATNIPSPCGPICPPPVIGAAPPRPRARKIDW